MNRRREALINIAFKYIQLLLSIVTGIVMVPIYLLYISPADYGAWLTCFSLVAWLAMFDPGIANILIQKISSAVGRKDYDSISQYLTVGLGVSVLVAFIVIARTAINFLGFIDSQASLVEAFRIVSLSTGLILMGYALTGVNYALHASIGVGLTYVAATMLKITTILVLLNSGYGFIALAYGELVSSSLIIFGDLFIFFYRMRIIKIHYKPSFKKSSELLGLFSISLGARLSKLVARNLDNVFIARFIGPEAVAMYSITATAPRQAENIIGQPIVALRPAIAHMSGSSDLATARQNVTRILRLVIWAIFMVIAGLWLFNFDFIYLWVGQKLFAGYSVNYLLVVLFFLHIWTNVFGMLGFSFGDIRRNNKFEIIYAVLLIPTLLLGTFIFGLIGVVYAHILVMLLTTAWYFPLSIIKRLKIAKDTIFKVTITILKALSAATVVILLFSLININGWMSFILSVFCMCATYFLILFILEVALRYEVYNASRLITTNLRSYSKK